MADRLADAGDVDRAVAVAERALAATKTVAGDYSGASSLIGLVRMLPTPERVAQALAAHAGLRPTDFGYTSQPAASSTRGPEAHNREVLILLLGEHPEICTTLAQV